MAPKQKQTLRPMEQNQSSTHDYIKSIPLLFNKDDKNIEVMKERLFSKWWWKNQMTTCRGIK